MSYDFMNRRDNVTKHSSVTQSLACINRYLSLGLPSVKANLGLAFYAKYFPTQGNCSKEATPGLNCPTVPMEDGNGMDNGKAGAITFLDLLKASPNMSMPLSKSPDGTCGAQ